MDLDRARTNLYIFAQLAKCPLTLWQARALSPLKHRITTILAPRQSGKSRSLALKGTQWAFRKPNQHVLIVSAGEDAARRLLAEVKRIVVGSPYLAPSVVDEMAGLIALTNGSVIRSVPASERQIRGWAVDLLLVDEAALVSDDLLLGAAIPTTAARPQARIVLASSATRADGAFFDHVKAAEAGSDHIALHRWSLADCSWISPSVIEAARESMTEARFKAEYEGVFASGADALFTRESLDRATRDYVADRLPDLRGPARVLAGVDWGATTDRSAICAIGRLAETDTFAVRTAHRWPAGEPLHHVIEAIASSPAHFDTLAMETNGLGMPCAQELARQITARPDAQGGGRTRLALVDVLEYEENLEKYKRAALRRQLTPGIHKPFKTEKLPVHVTAELKAAAYSTMRLLIERERLLIPASAEELLRELLMLRVDLSPSGTEHIEASTGHDDLADALMLATCPYRSAGGRWTTLLAQLARDSEEPPDVVPRVPTWASVCGEEVTRPGEQPGDAPRPASRSQVLSERVREAMETTTTSEEA